jgi:hypothetical protein
MYSILYLLSAPLLPRNSLANALLFLPLLVLWTTCKAEVPAQDVQVKGRLLWYALRPQTHDLPPLTFTIQMRGCKWIMQLESHDPMTIWRDLAIGFDGTLLYRFAPYLPNGEAGNSATILPGPIPYSEGSSYLDQATSLMWLAYCSRCYLSDNPSYRLPVYVQPAPQLRKLGWQDEIPVVRSFRTESVAPASADYIDNRTLSHPYTNCAFRTTDWSTNAGLLIPIHFRIDLKSPLYNASDTNTQVVPIATVLGETTDISTAPDAFNGPLPYLPGTVQMFDLRFQKSRQFRNPILYETNRWLSDSEVQATLAYKEQSEISKELNRANHLRQVWGPRAEIMIALVFGLGLLPILFTAWRRWKA